jgi:hypothetical protein
MWLQQDLLHPVEGDARQRARRIEADHTVRGALPDRGPVHRQRESLARQVDAPHIPVRRRVDPEEHVGDDTSTLGATLSVPLDPDRARGLADPQDPRDLLRRKIDVQAEDGDGALVRAEPSERADQVQHRLRHLVALDAVRHRSTPSLLESTRGDPEGRPPDPSIMRLDRCSPSQELRVGLGHRIARQVGIAREREQGSPELGALFPESPLRRLVGGHGRLIDHHIPLGTLDARNV